MFYRKIWRCLLIFNFLVFVLCDFQSSPHPDREAQFAHINETGSRYIAEGTPFVSVDCKKKESIGNFKNNGQEYRHTGDARKLYITADGGGSNGSRNRLWKLELAALAQETGLAIEVSHFPPGTSKWNKIEHRLFAYVSKNWEGKPLIDIVTVVKLIGSTATKGGLKVVCDVDERNYPIGIKVDNKTFGSIDIEFHGPNEGWNYTIKGFKN